MTNSTPTPVKAAVLGCGYWGKNLVRNVHALGALAAVADTTSIMEDPSISAVLIATPAETHFDLGLAALAAGKDVYVEKPLALTHARGARLVREA